MSDHNRQEAAEILEESGNLEGLVLNRTDDSVDFLQRNYHELLQKSMGWGQFGIRPADIRRLQKLNVVRGSDVKRLRHIISTYHSQP